MKKVILLISFILLSSCISIKNSTPDRTFAFDKNSEKGLVSGTFSFYSDKKKSPYDHYYYNIKYISDDINEVKKNSTSLVFYMDGFNGRYNGQFNDSKTYMFILDLKPGKYEINSFRFFWNGGMIQQNVNSKIYFSIPFEVKKGEIFYLGEFIQDMENKNVKPFIKIKDNFERDKSYFRQNYNLIFWNNAQNKVIKEGNNGEGLIEFAN